MTYREPPITKPVVTQRDDTAGGSHIGNVQSHYFLQGKHTAGAFSLTEIVFQSGSQGTPLHIHSNEEETYYVIEGVLEVHVGDERIVLIAGGSALLPRNVKHKVFPTGDKITRALMIISPPGLENMLIRLDRINPGEFDMEAVIKLSEEYGVQILPEID